MPLMLCNDFYNCNLIIYIFDASTFCSKQYCLTRVFIDCLFSVSMLLSSLVLTYFLWVAYYISYSNIWRPKQLPPRIPCKPVWGIQFTKKLIECFNLAKIILSCCTCPIYWPKQGPGLLSLSFSDSDSFGWPNKYFR